ncbi:DUF4468 domain-containing protein [Flavobacterium sandaracinum]|uniref:DUF4468 domain-containing protein n=1 Tax=Flavobacterium sandaracinum TaxID=2541733 RepID=A0A4R5DBV0_9FLAO|nr:DUF4468 domain-containing protein [Flavobacterium sandaracinum]TDE07733.1 DUF4468 domain-containing protein [Flavobacterium sandaracinum]
MKKLFTLCLFAVFSINTFGQNIVKDSISQKYEAHQIIELESLKADVIYTKTKEWIALNYKSAQDVIQLADKESLKIIVKGNFNSTLFMKQGSISHTLVLDFKDGRMRYTYSDFSYYSSGSGSMAFESKNLGFKKSIIKSTEKDLKTSIESLKKYILQNTNNNNDW